MDRDRSDRLLAYLYQQAATPEYQCRFQWQKNSLAFWDNRACQHYANSDYYPQHRQMERVTIIGDTPYYRESAQPNDGSGFPFHGLVARRQYGTFQPFTD